MTAIIAEGEDPAVKAEELRTLVAERLQLPETVKNLESEQQRLETEIESAKQKWEKITHFLEKAGIALPPNTDDIPF